jgi:hypothetical protein
MGEKRYDVAGFHPVRAIYDILVELQTPNNVSAVFQLQ